MTLSHAPNDGLIAIGQTEPDGLAQRAISGHQGRKMAKRKAISKKTRFEVFKRDSFTCQYCGKAAPNVILHVDHIDPVSKGGGNDIINLITACEGCNGGKSDTKLDDQTTLAKQVQQLAELSAKREQLKMMVDWRKGMKSIDSMSLQVAIDHFGELFDGWQITSEKALAKLRKLIKDFGLNIVMEAMEVAKDQYATTLNNENVNQAFTKLGGICNNLSKPDESGLFYCRGIVRNRMYCNELVAITLLRKAQAAGAGLDELKAAAREARNWNQWQDWMNEFIEGAE